VLLLVAQVVPHHFEVDVEVAVRDPIAHRLWLAACDPNNRADGSPSYEAGFLGEDIAKLDR
jgi:hypothetical protein